MKFPTFLLGLAALALPLHAQENIGLEEAQNIAQKLIETLGKPADAPLVLDVDGDKPQGLKANETGLIVIPQKNLTAETFGAATSAVVPVGELWMRKIVLSADGKATPNDVQRVLSITSGDKNVEVIVYLLGVAKNDKGALELVLFARGKESIVRVPIEKRELAKQEFPITVSAEKTGEQAATISMQFLSQYEAKVQVKKAE